MPKVDLYDLETFTNLPTIFANPPEIHHRIEQSPLSVLNAATPPNVLEETVNVMRRSEPESSGVFYGPKEQKLKLEMEIFGDLSAYWPTKAMASAKPFQNAVDELNTPVFEKAPFDYDRQSHSTGLLDVAISTEDPFNFKIKSEISNFDNVNIEDNLMIKEDTIAFNEGESKDISNMMSMELNTDMDRSVNNCIVISSQGISTNSSNMFTPTHSEYTDISHNPSDKVTPMYEEDDVNLEAVNPSDIFLNNTSDEYGINISDENSNSQFSNPSYQYIILQTAPAFETPDNSRSASDYSENSTSPGLKLNIDQNFKSTTTTIDTPDVIDTIDAIESEKSFNILNFINDEDIYTAAPVLSTINLPALSSTVIPLQQPTTSRTKLVAKRKYKHDDDDDDEDYVPPTKKKVASSNFAKVQQELATYDSDSDCSDDEEVQNKPARRGRPPKRNFSISSEDCPTGKYREMRDKNNEASRKSRLKRKLKEVAQEDEASILEEKNTKLRAQVEQLERTVNNFRNNLMQILLSK